MGKGSSQPQYVPQTSTTIQKSDPWSGQQPYLTDVFGQAQNQYATPLTVYSGEVPGVPKGQQYAPFSPETQLGMIGTEAEALGGQVVPTATNYATDVLSGKYLSADNPYFSNMVENIRKTVTPAVESQFSGAGRYGSGAMANALASTITDKAGELAYQNYLNERGSMDKASYLAPQTAQLGYLPSQQLMNVGASLEDQTQRAINQAMSNQQFSQMEPWQRLQLYNNMIQGNYGGTSTSTGEQFVPRSYSNTAGNILGGLSSLGGLGMLAYSIFSDKRTKKNIKPLDNKGILNTIMRLDPVTFDYKPEYGKPKQVGFVADDLEKEVPGMVFKDYNGFRRVAPLAMIPILVKGMQEQQSQIARLTETGKE